MKYLSNAIAWPPGWRSASRWLAATAQAQAQAKPPTPAAIAAAKEILAMKNANAIYANAVPNIVQRTMDTLMQTNLNYQKDLNEVAVVVAKKPGRPRKGNRRRDGEDLRQRLHRAGIEGSGDVLQDRRSARNCCTQEPKAIQHSMPFMNQWAQSFAEEVNGQFRAEMRKRGKEI